MVLENVYNNTDNAVPTSSFRASIEADFEPGISVLDFVNLTGPIINCVVPLCLHVDCGHNLLGKGAYGDVRRCVHETSFTELAAKTSIIRDDWGSAEKRLHFFRESVFLNEIQGNSNCENIVFYHGYIRLERKLFLFLELMDGSIKDIRVAVHKANRPWGFPEMEAAYPFMKQICCGLKYIHQKGYMHRDLKPSNVLYRQRDGVLKLADFGTIKFYAERSEEEVARNVHSLFPGTPVYRAPEVLMGLDLETDQAMYNESCDIWSLTIMLIELLHGKHPISEHQEYEVFRTRTSSNSQTNATVWLMRKINGKILDPDFQIIPPDLHVSDSLRTMIERGLTRATLNDLTNDRPTAEVLYTLMCDLLGENDDKNLLKDWFNVIVG